MSAGDSGRSARTTSPPSRTISADHDTHIYAQEQPDKPKSKVRKRAQPSDYIQPRAQRSGLVGGPFGPWSGLDGHRPRHLGMQGTVIYELTGPLERHRLNSTRWQITPDSCVAQLSDQVVRDAAGVPPFDSGPSLDVDVAPVERLAGRSDLCTSISPGDRALRRCRRTSGQGQHDRDHRSGDPGDSDGRPPGEHRSGFSEPRLVRARGQDLVHQMITRGCRTETDPPTFRLEPAQQSAARRASREMAGKSF